MVSLVLLFLLYVFGCTAQPSSTYMVPMRDGVELHTIVILNSTLPRGVVLMRTPYGTDTLTSTAQYYAKLGFNTVSQDFRGRYLSQGSFDLWNHSSPDAYDTMEWIVSQPWSNKKIFTQGTSANGIACYLQAEDQPEWLKAQFVVFATGELYKSVFQGGAYRYSLMHGWLNLISEGDYESNILANEAYNVFWEDTNNDDKWGLIKYPAVHLTGWYDIFLQQQLDAYDAYKFKSSAFFKEYNYLVVMPGGHCAGGEIQWPTSELGDAMAVFLSDYLFSVMDVFGNPPSIGDEATFIYYYVLGPGGKNEIGNYWANATYWPTPNITNFYFFPDGSLSTVTPTQSSSPTNFIYDPNDPVPTIGGNNLLLPKCGPWDQSSLDNRSDIVSFTSLPFKEPMAITGHIFAELYVSSNCTDTDFTVKLLDVFPNGTTSMLIQDGILRMRWRENNTSPTMMTPGTIYGITVDVWSTSYIMNIGHSLRVSVSSSNYPRFSINFNNGNPLVNPGSPLVAENSIYHDQNSPSHIQIPVVPIPDSTTLLEKLAVGEKI